MRSATKFGLLAIAITVAVGCFQQEPDAVALRTVYAQFIPQPDDVHEWNVTEDAVHEGAYIVVLNSAQAVFWVRDGKAYWANEAAAARMKDAVKAPVAVPVEAHVSEALVRVEKDAAREPLFRAMDMDESEAARLEAKLTESPEDIETRTVLAHYYARQHWQDPVANAKFLAHAVELVQRAPRSRVVAKVYTVDDEKHAPLVEAWEAQVAAHENDARVLGNAAMVIQFVNRERATQLFRKCAELEPANPQVWRELAEHLENFARHEEGDARHANAIECLAALDKASALAPSTHDRWRLIESMGRAAHRAGDLTRAQRHAEELINPDKSLDRDTADELRHTGHTLLGHLAIGKDNLAEATRHLHASAKVRGTPVLSTFGPNMSLANALLARGEKDAVLAYLDACGRFWDDSDLAEWKDAIRADTAPDWEMQIRL